MNTSNLNYNGKSSIDRINEVIKGNKRIVGGAQRYVRFGQKVLMISHI